MSIFSPDIHVSRIYDIDMELLAELGIKGLVFDLDNTITPWHKYAPDRQAADWFALLKQKGFLACILSNSEIEKVAAVGEWLGIPVLGSAGKPKRKGFLRAAKELGLDVCDLAMVGDQLLTDMAGGNKAGFFTVLTDPIAKEEFWGTRYFSRNIERLLGRSRIK